jgi:hypothetical protein
MALAREYLTTYGPERFAFVVRHAREAAPCGGDGEALRRHP